MNNKVIFLDVDGVLNGYSTFIALCYKAFKKLHLLRFVKKHYDLFGVHTNKVRRLAKIVKATDAKVVISSSWRSTWYDPYEEKDKSDKQLEDKLKQFNIEVIGITPRRQDGKRGLEILSYLNEHEEIDSFVILDDEDFDIKDWFNNEFVCTSKDGKITGAWYENAGLKRKHVKQAIKILNERE